MSFHFLHRPSSFRLTYNTEIKFSKFIYTPNKLSLASVKCSSTGAEDEAVLHAELLHLHNLFRMQPFKCICVLIGVIIALKAVLKWCK